MTHSSKNNVCLWTKISKCEVGLSNCVKRLGNCESKIKNINSKLSIPNTESNEQQQNGGKEEKNKNKCWIMKKSFWEKLDGFIVLIFIFILFWIFKVYDFFFSKKFSQDCYDFLNPFITKFSQCLFLAIVTFILLCLIIYYFINRNKDIEKKADKIQTYKIGHDITRLISWFFSSSGLLFVIVFTLVALVAFFIASFEDIKCAKAKLELTALVISITLATIIPSIISKILVQSEIEEKINERVKNEYERYNSYISSKRKDDAHESRMISSLLYNMAELQEEPINAIRYAIWSIGWASKAVCQYLVIKDEYPKSKDFIKEIINNHISPSYEFCKDKFDNNPQINNKSSDMFRLRDLSSIIFMHALMLTEKSNYSKKIEELIKNLEYLFIQNNPDIDFSDINCQVVEKDREFNKELKECTIAIIEELEEFKNNNKTTKE